MPRPVAVTLRRPKCLGIGLIGIGVDFKNFISSIRSKHNQKLLTIFNIFLNLGFVKLILYFVGDHPLTDVMGYYFLEFIH